MHSIVIQTVQFYLRRELFRFGNLFLVFGITLDINAKFLQQTVAMAVIIRLIMRPMPIKSKTEVGNFQMTRRRDEEVIRLDIAMNPAKSMCLFNAQYHFSDVKLCPVLAECIFAD